MAKVLVLILGLVAVAVAVKLALSPMTATDPSSITEPTRQLDHVRARARELQGDLQRNADRADVAR